MPLHADYRHQATDRDRCIGCRSIRDDHLWKWHGHTGSPKDCRVCDVGLINHARVVLRAATSMPVKVADALRPNDVRLLAVYLSRANRLARLDRELTAEIPDAPPRRPTWLVLDVPVLLFLSITVTTLIAVACIGRLIFA